MRNSDGPVSQPAERMRDQHFDLTIRKEELEAEVEALKKSVESSAGSGKRTSPDAATMFINGEF